MGTTRTAGGAMSANESSEMCIAPASAHRPIMLPVAGQLVAAADGPPRGVRGGMTSSQT